MKISHALGAAALLGLVACGMTDEMTAQARGADGLMAWPELLERPRPKADATLRYGDAAEQAVDLWLPEGDGPHPVVLMVHGGCWQSEIADRTIMDWIANDLRGRGIAVWNIDYRGVDRPGGGYPGTFADAAIATDLIRRHAAAYKLDTSKIVAVGHSAGGHLALWLAARPKLPQGSALVTADPLRIAAVVSLGGLPDLEEAAREPGSGCGTEVVAKLTGPASTTHADPYADTSVPRLAPIGVRQVLVNGAQDRIIPTAYAEGYAAPMRTAGDDVTVRMIDRTGHVELIAPETEAWKATVEEIEKALGR